MFYSFLDVYYLVYITLLLTWYSSAGLCRTSSPCTSQEGTRRIPAPGSSLLCTPVARKTRDIIVMYSTVFVYTVEYSVQALEDAHILYSVQRKIKTDMLNS